MSLPVSNIIPPIVGVSEKKKRKYTKKNDAVLVPKVDVPKRRRKVITLDAAGNRVKRKPSAYNVFVQDRVKSPEFAGMPQTEKMKKVAALWKASKTSKSTA